MSGSIKCFLIEKEGYFMSEARSRRVGGATRDESMSVGIKDLIIRPFGEFSGCGGRVKERAPILFVE